MIQKKQQQSSDKNEKDMVNIEVTKNIFVFCVLYNICLY